MRSALAMPLDSLVPTSWRAHPRSFVALMSLYESNFLRLAALAGELRAFEGSRASIVAGDCELVLSLRERSAHTSTFLLTYLLEAAPPDALLHDAAAVERVPDVELRVYHDARLCEVLPAAPQAGAGPQACRAERELGQRWSRNMMLNKWLEYCLERGHSFGEAAARARDQSSEDQSARCRTAGPAAGKR